jgi:hypothetical protein
MDMDEKIKYYPYKKIGELARADTKAITSMLMCMMILEINDNPDTISMYRKLSVTTRFRATERENYKKFFRERFYFENGREQYALEITDEFVKFVVDRIEKVGEIYNVRFK